MADDTFCGMFFFLNIPFYLKIQQCANQSFFFVSGVFITKCVYEDASLMPGKYWYRTHLYDSDKDEVFYWSLCVMLC